MPPRAMVPEKPEHSEMGMGDDPVIQVGDLLHCREGLERSLDAGQDIPDQPGHNELSPDVRMDVSQPPAHGQPEIDEDGHNRDEHPDTAGNGQNLQPGGDGSLQQVMGADMSIDHEKRPKSDQGEGMAVERGASKRWERHNRRWQWPEESETGPRRHGRKTRQELRPACRRWPRCRGSRRHCRKNK